MDRVHAISSLAVGERSAWDRAHERSMKRKQAGQSAFMRIFCVVVS
jgi:hypothetical protein